MSNSPELSRREALKRLAAVGATMRVALDAEDGAQAPAQITIAGQPVEIMVASLSPSTVHITVSPLDNGRVTPVAYTGALASNNPGEVRVRARQPSQLSRVRAGDLRV